MKIKNHAEIMLTRKTKSGLHEQREWYEKPK